MSYTKEGKDKFKQEMKVRVYKWSVKLVKYLRKLSKEKEYLVRSIIDQVLRSGTSVCANYVEAIGAPTTKDFRKFLAYSLKSCNETKYWLALIKDTDIDNSEELEHLLQESIELSKILGKSVSTLYREN